MKSCLGWPLRLAAPVGLALTAYLAHLTAGVPAALAAAPRSEVIQEGGSELTWLFAVFFITWAFFFGYVFLTSRRQREMQQEIDHLRRTLQERDSE